MNDVKLQEEIGSGSFGKVFKAYYQWINMTSRLQTSTGKTIAVKVIELDTGDLSVVELQREINSMSSCNSSHITRYYGSFMIKTKLWVLMDYADCGSLRSMVNSTLETNLSLKVGT